MENIFHEICSIINRQKICNNLDNLSNFFITKIYYIIILTNFIFIKEKCKVRPVHIFKFC